MPPELEPRKRAKSLPNPSRRGSLVKEANSALNLSALLKDNYFADDRESLDEPQIEMVSEIDADEQISPEMRNAFIGDDEKVIVTRPRSNAVIWDGLPDLADFNSDVVASTGLKRNVDKATDYLGYTSKANTAFKGAGKAGSGMEKLGDFAGLSKAGEALNGWYTKHQTGIDTITTSVSTGLAAISGVLNALSLYAGKKRIKAGKDFLLLMSTLKEQAESLGLSAQHNAELKTINNSIKLLGIDIKADKKSQTDKKVSLAVNTGKVVIGALTIAGVMLGGVPGIAIGLIPTIASTIHSIVREVQNYKRVSKLSPNDLAKLEKAKDKPEQFGPSWYKVKEHMFSHAENIHYADIMVTSARSANLLVPELKWMGAGGSVVDFYSEPLRPKIIKSLSGEIGKWNKDVSRITYQTTPIEFVNLIEEKGFDKNKKSLEKAKTAAQKEEKDTFHFATKTKISDFVDEKNEQFQEIVVKSHWESKDTRLLPHLNDEPLVDIMRFNAQKPIGPRDLRAAAASNMTDSKSKAIDIFEIMSGPMKKLSKHHDFWAGDMPSDW